MFSGIIEELGNIKEIIKNEGGWQISLFAKTIITDLNIGDSVAVNGVCLTVESVYNDFFKVIVIKETLDNSNLSGLKIEEKINLERSLKYNDRINGHLVQGHVESIGKIVNKATIGEEVIFSIKIDKNLLRYCIYKGSIAIDGISLTIAKINENTIDVAIIPHTFINTTLSYKKIGSSINIETDMIAKYVERNLNN